MSGAAGQQGVATGRSGAKHEEQGPQGQQLKTAGPKSWSLGVQGQGVGPASARLAPLQAPRARRRETSSVHPQGKVTRQGSSRRLLQLPLLAALALTFGVGCARSSVVETALNGDLKTLRAELQQADKRGDLGEAEVRRVAHAVASREVRSVDVELAIPRIRQVHACAGSLSAVLEERAEQADDAGAEAQLMLIDAGLDNRTTLIDRYQRAESGAWRAVAARLTTGLGHAGLRQQLMGDGDERVRRAALTAALVARDKRDISSLLEAARVDPDALSRSRATRAAGNIGGQEVVQGLRDRWERADETTRVTIVEAWAMPGALGSGGESQLVWVVETGEALPAVSAAGALIRTESQYASSGVALLDRVVKGGAATERKLAIAWLPLGEPSTLERLKEAAKDADPEIQAAALGRLLHTGERADAEKQLFKLARGKTGAAFPARLALAAGGVAEVGPLLKQDLEDKQSSVRQRAALALATISQYSSAALAMGDESPTVRTRVACSLLLALK